MGKWEMVKLDDVCSLITDGTHQTPEYCCAQEGYPFLSSKDVTTEVINWDDIKYIPKRLHEQLYKRLAPQVNDILLAKNGTTGVAALVDRNCVFDIYVSLALLRPKEYIYPQYLLKVINSPLARSQFSAHLKGIGVPNLHLSEIRNTKIPLPPLPVQQQIADVLDRASALTQKRKTQIEKLDLLIKSQFVEMFGDAYENCKISLLPDVCRFIDYRGKTPEKSDMGIPLITAKNVKDNHFSIEPREYIPTDNYDSVMTRGVPQINDVLFTTEAPLGNVCRIPPVFEKFCVGQRIITMQPFPEIVTSEYLENALLTQRFQNEMWRKSSGSTVKGIRSKELALLSIPVPEYEKQKEFSGIVQQVEAQKSLLRQSLKKLELNYKSLMQKCFQGEIF